MNRGPGLIQLVTSEVLVVVATEVGIGERFWRAGRIAVRVISAPTEWADQDEQAGRHDESELDHLPPDGGAH